MLPLLLLRRRRDAAAQATVHAPLPRTAVAPHRDVQHLRLMVA
jgi:hypothetical protein